MTLIWRAKLAICLAAVLVAGCGGGGGPDFDPNTTGTVPGTVVEIASGSGISGVEVQIGGRSATSTSPAGAFSVAGIPPGTQLITVTLPFPYVLTSSTPMYCIVVAGQVTVLPGPIYVSNESPPPPPIWSSSDAHALMDVAQDDIAIKPTIAAILLTATKYL